MPTPFLNPPAGETQLRAPTWKDSLYDMARLLTGVDPDNSPRPGLELLMGIAPFAFNPGSKEPIRRLGYGQVKPRWYGRDNPDPQTIRQVMSVRQGLDPDTSWFSQNLRMQGRDWDRPSSFSLIGRPDLDARSARGARAFTEARSEQSMAREAAEQTYLPGMPSIDSRSGQSPDDRFAPSYPQAIFGMKSEAWRPQGMSPQDFQALLERLRLQGLWP